jgi:anthraniloyl-CoA monooxygenase
MRVACLGGGPAGLYFAISAKLRDPHLEVDVFERHRRGETFGWGVVFSDQTMENLLVNDPVSAATIRDSFAHWDEIEVSVSGQSVSSGGHGFIGIGRRNLLRILTDRAEQLGVNLHFETEFDTNLDAYADYDLIVASDGINSQIRTKYADRFGVDIDVRRNRFCWLGTTRMFDAFAFLFEKTEAGWIWAHAYRFDETHSTFIVECAPETWEGLGLDKMEAAESTALCERIFARHLDGHALLSNAAHLRGSAAWINFRRVLCQRWSFDNVVLLGDAAHTAHFSIGSGTKLALEDAIKLADVISRTDVRDRATMAGALGEYQDERHVEVLKIQNSARNSTEWFETLDRYIGFDPMQFTYSLMTRSQRVSHENLRLRDPAWLDGVERWFAGKAEANQPCQPMFAPFALRGLMLANRVVVPPMLTYSADADGSVTPFHAVHYGARALGGAALIMTESLAVSPEGRATPACAGLYDDSHIDGWKHITEFARKHSKARICAQLSHAGPRAGCKIPFDAAYDEPMDNPWPIVAASALPWKSGGIVPRSLDVSEMPQIAQQFVDAARRAEAAGFDMIELHAGHGSLLSSFITPVLNHRTDDYGGSLENRMRLPLAVVEEVRRVWPQTKPLAVRISANDWVGDDGVTPDEAVTISRMFKAAGADLIDVSAGETSSTAKPVYGRMFQTPMADHIRNAAQMPVIAVGNIVDSDQINSIVTAGRADLVALGRPHLADPVWTMRAAAACNEQGQFVPPPYILGHAQAVRLSAAARSGKA